MDAKHIDTKEKNKILEIFNNLDAISATICSNFYAGGSLELMYKNNCRAGILAREIEIMKELICIKQDESICQ